MIRLSPTSTRPSLLALGAIILVTLLIGMSIGLSIGAGDPTAVVTETPGATVGASAPSAKPTLRPLPTPTKPPAPTPAPATGVVCDLPAGLPTNLAPAVDPIVEGDAAVSMLFTSHLSHQGPEGSVVISDNVSGDWGVGLWFVAAGSREARLLVATRDGMVIPIALSPTGEVAVVWWLPARNAAGESVCASGIYRLSTITRDSELVMPGEWSFSNTESEQDPGGPGITWFDPRTISGERLSYSIPAAAFSSKGHLAIIDRTRIDIYRAGATEPTWTHPGSCTDWAWARTAATFVAGCEDMTSAWYVEAGEGMAPGSVALPRPLRWKAYPDWEGSPGRAIGLVDDGRIRIARFYGFPTGCEDPGCTLPPVGYAMTTLNPRTGDASSRTSLLNWIVNYASNEVSHFSADATWLYVEAADERGARTIDIGSGVITATTYLQNYAGASQDGTALYGWQVDEPGGRVSLSSVHATGATPDVATIRWPDGVVASEPVIEIFGLQVVKPPA